MVATFSSHTLSVSISCQPSDVYAFASDPENLPKWATGLGSSIKRQGDRWITQGSTGDGCWEWPCCGQKPSSRRIRLGCPLQGSSPAEIVGQIARGDALEAHHPALQAAMVGVDILDVERTVAHPNAGGDIDRLVV